MQLGRPQDDIERHFNISIEYNPSSAESYHFYSDYLYDINRKTQAREMERRALENLKENDSLSLPVVGLLSLL